MTDEEINLMFQDADIDGDGKVRPTCAKLHKKKACVTEIVIDLRYLPIPSLTPKLLQLSFLDFMEYMKATGILA